MYGAVAVTLLIGLRCADGIIIAADRKVMYGEEASTADKVFQQSGLVLAFEGLTGLRDDFLLLLEMESKRAGGLGSLYQAKIIIEDILAELSQRYEARLGEDAGIGVLLGGLASGNSGPARLYYISGVGYGEQITYRCSGHGGEYAHTLAKFLHDERLGLEHQALRAAFTIAYISEDVDTTVGGRPQVAMVQDDRKRITFATNEVIDHACELAKKAKQSLASAFGLTDAVAPKPANPKRLKANNIGGSHG